MDEVFGITLLSMHQDMQRLDRIALNIANVSTPGFKREVAGAHAFSAALQAAGQGSEPQGAQGSEPSMQVRFDRTPGTLRLTGQPLDVALTGDGFLEVSTDQGLAYTRQGNLRLDPRGRLVTAQGHPVMGKSGEIFLTTATPVIDAAGRITEPNATSGPSAGQPGAAVAHLKVIRFDNPEIMQRMGEGLLSPGEGPKALNEGESQLRQGALENSNVSTLHEMVQMMQTMRHFESMQRAVQGYDDMVGMAVRKLGDIS